MQAFKSMISAALLLAAVAVFSSMTLIGGIEGVWSYEASNTPPEYSKGEIEITKDDDAYQVTLRIGQTPFGTENVSVEGNDVSFDIYIDGMKIDVSLTIDGDKMTGKAESYEGSFPLKGSRK